MKNEPALEKCLGVPIQLLPGCGSPGASLLTFGREEGPTIATCLVPEVYILASSSCASLGPKPWRGLARIRESSCSLAKVGCSNLFLRT
jgi:hypothetical protein